VSDRISARDDPVKDRRDFEMPADVISGPTGEPMSVGGVCYNPDDLMFAHDIAVSQSKQQRLADGKSRKAGSAPVDLFRVGHCTLLM
jgi:hypothetical protein